MTSAALGPAGSRIILEVDQREEGSELLELVRRSGWFELQVKTLRAGDYRVQGTVAIERKTHADLAVSVITGRLFQQAAALVRSRLRSLILVEGPATAAPPAVHPHAITGAVLSVAVCWRVPVIWSAGPEESLQILRMLAEQHSTGGEAAVDRYGYRPRRLESRRLFVLQGLPGIGPKLARRLLAHFGSVEKVMCADEKTLAGVAGVGPRKAAGIRKIVS